MYEVFHKTLLVSFLLSASVFATESNLLSLATNGAVNAEQSAAAVLNDSEMKDIRGGKISISKNCLHKYV